MNAINSIGGRSYGTPQDHGSAFDQALAQARNNLQASLAMGGTANRFAIPQGTATGNMPGFGQWMPVWIYVGPGPANGGSQMGPPLASGGCARSGASSCGCSGNLGSQMPTGSGGQPISAYDFRPLAGEPGMGGCASPPMAPGMSPSNGMPAFGGMRPGMAMGQFPMAGTNPAGNPSMGMPHRHNGAGDSPIMGHTAMHGAAGHGMMAHGMMGHDGHGYYSLDGIGMVHAKDELRRGDHLRDPTFFNRVARGEFGEFGGVGVNQGPNGDLTGQVYISGHPAAFHQLYDQGRGKGLEGEELEQYIAEELTNINNLDDIDERYWCYWEGRGVPRATRDHDLHNTGAIAGVLGPGQTLSLNGAHQFDNLTDPDFNFTAVNSDPSGTYIDFFRLSDNNDPNNGHHEDLVAALRIYLSPQEVRELASGTKPIDIVNRRFVVDDNADDYRLSPVALQRMAGLGMPIY